VIAGPENLSSSRDLLSLPVEDDVRLTQEGFQAQRWQAQKPVHHEQALLKQQIASSSTVCTLAFADVAFFSST
jgi:hypothetical protein